MYVGIFDNERVRNLKLKGKNKILIRIFDRDIYYVDKPNILNIDEYNDVLELYIKDLSKCDDTSYLRDCFKELNNFILDNDFDEVIVHCTLGMSRSPAIMICIGYILNNMGLVDMISKKYRFYNKNIVNKFLEYNYIVKDNYDKEVIFDGYEEKKKNNTKCLIKII